MKSPSTAVDSKCISGEAILMIPCACSSAHPNQYKHSCVLIRDVTKRTATLTMHGILLGDGQYRCLRYLTISRSHMAALAPSSFNPWKHSRIGCQICIQWHHRQCPLAFTKNIRLTINPVSARNNPFSTRNSDVKANKTITTTSSTHDVIFCASWRLRYPFRLS